MFLRHFDDVTYTLHISVILSINMLHFALIYRLSLLKLFVYRDKSITLTVTFLFRPRNVKLEYKYK